MKKFLSCLISITIIMLIFPIKVYADGGTYVQLTSEAINILKYKTTRMLAAASSYEIRCIYIYNSASSNGRGWVFFSSLNSGDYVAVNYNGTLQNTYLNTKQTINGTDYYCGWVNFTGSSDEVNEVYIPYINSTSSNFISDGISYTFGDNSIEPGPDFTYGEIKELSYSTSIVGSGNGTGNANIDTISWYPFADSNGKMYGTGGKVELRVVPGDYISGTQEGVLTQTYSDFVLDYANAGHLATVNAYDGSYKVSWGVVMQKLTMTWPALQLLWDGEYWKKLGWVYQARYHSDAAEDDTWSEWQTIYTITSSTPTGTNGLDPSDGTAMPGFYQDVKDSYNTTSVVNNNTNTTYYINNVPVTVNQTQDQQNPSSGDSFWDWIGTILSSLLDLVGTIGGWISDLIGAVLGLAGDIINGILGLFELPDFTINNYNTEVQNIKNNSGIFGQAVDFTSDVKTQLDLISTTPQDLSFTFPGITLMNVEVIPEVNASYTQIVSDLGLTDFHNMVYMFTDGFVIISLIVLVYRKLMGVLRK